MILNHSKYPAAIYAGLLCGIALIALFSRVSADVPPYINFQATITDSNGDPIPDGNHTVVVQIFDDPTLDTGLIFAENHDILSENGIVSFLIGSGNITYGGDNLLDTHFTSPDRWLSITVDDDPPMNPRIRLVTVPYSYKVSSVAGASGGNITSDVVLSGKIKVDEFRMETGANQDYVLKSDDLGNGTWQPAEIHGTYWELDGNLGPGIDFLGTIGDFDLIFKTYDFTSMIIEPTGIWDNGGETVHNTPNILGGRAKATVNVQGATIAGGGDYWLTPDDYKYNKVTDNFGSIGGGAMNRAGDDGGGVENAQFATVGGGYSNTANRGYSVVSGGNNNFAGGADGHSSVGGGKDNQANGSYSFVGGGEGNIADETYSTIGGGAGNTASGYGSTIPGGENNSASGTNSMAAGGSNNSAVGSHSFAAGKGAKADHNYSFVWDGANTSELHTTAEQQFLVRAPGGFAFGNRQASPGRFVIGASNGVCINCEDPGSFTLAVEGSVGAREIKVTQSPWPDYVFEKDYQLPPLSDLKGLLDENKHLPGIPKAAEIEKNGLNLGEMQSLSMEKIEELYLYVLQLHDENRELRTRIEKLEKMAPRLNLPVTDDQDHD